MIMVMRDDGWRRWRWKSGCGGRLAPSLGLMHYGLMLAGLGTALLGPILPLLARDWELGDAESGLLMMAKFCGAFLGGVSVSRHLRRSLLVGWWRELAGLAGLRWLRGWRWGGLGCLWAGLGWGRY